MSRKQNKNGVDPGVAHVTLGAYLYKGCSLQEEVWRTMGLPRLVFEHFNCKFITKKLYVRHNILNYNRTSLLEGRPRPVKAEKLYI